MAKYFIVPIYKCFDFTYWMVRKFCATIVISKKDKVLPEIFQHAGNSNVVQILAGKFSKMVNS